MATGKIFFRQNRKIFPIAHLWPIGESDFQKRAFSVKIRAPIKKQLFLAKFEFQFYSIRIQALVSGRCLPWFNVFMRSGIFLSYEVLHFKRQVISFLFFHLVTTQIHLTLEVKYFIAQEITRKVYKSSKFLIFVQFLLERA